MIRKEREEKGRAKRYKAVQRTNQPNPSSLSLSLHRITRTRLQQQDLRCRGRTDLPRGSTYRPLFVSSRGRECRCKKLFLITSKDMNIFDGEKTRWANGCLPSNIFILRKGMQWRCAERRIVPIVPTWASWSTRKLTAQEGHWPVKSTFEKRSRNNFLRRNDTCTAHLCMTDPSLSHSSAGMAGWASLNSIRGKEQGSAYELYQLKVERIRSSCIYRKIVCRIVDSSQTYGADIAPNQH